MISTQKNAHNSRNKAALHKAIKHMSMFIMAVVLVLSANAIAEGTRLYPEVQKYQGQANGQYELLNSYSVSSFCYGKQSIGSFYISGLAEHQEKHNGFSSYAATGPLVFGYSYDGSYKTSVKCSCTVRKQATENKR